MKEMTLATAGFERYAKTTRRAAFLAEMEQVVPWRDLCRVVSGYMDRLEIGSPDGGQFHT
jgi:transposase, IS5 family